MRKLLVSGCSFTVSYDHTGWANSLANHYDVPCHNYASQGAGNNFISRSIIHGVSEHLKNYNADDLFVTVMWSGAGRMEIYRSDISDLLEDFTTDENPISLVDQNVHWLKLRSHLDEKYSRAWYDIFYDDVFADICTLENILRVQWFLKLHNIKYVMTVFAPSCLPEEHNRNNPDIKYLYDMIDWGKFVDVNSCMEWCHYESGLPMDTNEKEKTAIYARHPTPDQHNAFTKQILIPFIDKLYPNLKEN